MLLTIGTIDADQTRNRNFCTQALKIFASNSPQTHLNLTCWNILLILRFFAHFSFNVRGIKFQKSAKSCLAS